MKSKFKLLLALVPAIVMFYGCPVGISYTLGKPGTEKIDKKLLGTWITDDSTAEFSKVTFEKKDDYSYSIEVSGTSDTYMIDAKKFTGWVTTIGGETFIYSQPAEGTESDYYLYHFKFTGDKSFKSHDVSLLVNGTDGIKSTEDYRKEVEQSIKMEGGLSEEKTWIKK